MYNKLFTKILDSSIWLESMPTRIVWITLLAAMDEDGYAHFSAVENLAARARVTVDECNAAVTALSSADKNSADPDNDGRRIERVNGGFVILNAIKYRELVNQVSRRNATRLRVQKFREKNSNSIGNASVTKCNAPYEYECTPDTATEKREYEGKLKSRLGKIFNRRESTVWSEKEEKSFRAFLKLKIPDEEIEVVERLHKSDCSYKRKDILALLNNFNTEVTRAHDFFKNPPPPRTPSTPPWKRAEIIDERIKVLTSEFQATQDEGVRVGIRDEISMLRSEKQNLQTSAIGK